MAKVVTDDKHYQNIASTIRQYNEGDTSYYKPSEMAEGVAKVYAKGAEDGKKSEYDAFWDDFQQKGNRTEYTYGFAGKGWTRNNFSPKYDIKLKNGSLTYIFRDAFHNVDVSTIFERNGIKFDFSGVTNIDNMFEYSMASRLPEIGSENIISAKYLFYVSWTLVTVDKLTLSPTCNVSEAFFRCDLLKNITIGNEIAANGWNLGWSSRLTHESIMSFINKLADKSEDTSGTVWAITFGATNLAKLTDEEKAIATEKGWTLA